jgi:hypothetical protein
MASCSSTAIGEVYRGDSDSFRGSSRSDLPTSAGSALPRPHRGTNLDIGTSYAIGPSALVPDFNAQRIGFDATFRYRPLRRAIYRQFIGPHRDRCGAGRRCRTGTSERLWFYVSGDYQFARRGSSELVARFRSGRAGRRRSARTPGGRLHLTFRPTSSRSSAVPYRRTQYAECSIDANELLFQINFAIGAHGRASVLKMG